MKHSFLFLFPVIVSVVSCNSEPKQSTQISETNDTSKKEEIKVMIPNTVCYSHITGKDTIFFKTEIFPNVVTGSLSYKFHEKDSNKGDIDGKLNGDTLVADYKFMSEGKQSITQVAFLIKDSNAMQGYGTMEEKDGKIVFKNLNEVDFKNGTKLQKVPCPLQ